MALPELTRNGLLPLGIHAASLGEVMERFGSGNTARARGADLLRGVVNAALHYETIKRVMVWGSFATAKDEPNDLDYSLIVSVDHTDRVIAEEHRRFLVPLEARQYYGVDRGYLIVKDYPLDIFIERLDFMCSGRAGKRLGVLEINLRGEVMT